MQQELTIYSNNISGNKEGLNETKYVLGLFIPGALVIFFTRVTYSHVIGLLLTVALIAASVYKGYTDSLSLIIVDALSLTVGFAYSKMVRERAKKRS